MRIALYARVSTPEQTVKPQLHALREYARRRGAEPMEYVDAAVSGRRDRRPALDRPLAAARRREVDAVAVVRVDRFARSLAHLARLGEELGALGIELVSLTEGVDTRTPGPVRDVRRLRAARGRPRLGGDRGGAGRRPPARGSDRPTPPP